MRVVAMINGVATELTTNQLIEFIRNKIPRRLVDDGNIRQCANYILTHNGTTGGGGVGMKYSSLTNNVFHISHGQMGRQTGCTVFFAKDRNHADVAVIVAIGHHVQRERANNIYLLDWAHSKFHLPAGARVRL